jgi:hypothetical protein
MAMSEGRKQPRKKRCRFCRELFNPGPRAGSRQVSCSRPECQKARKKASQDHWVAQNPGYFKGLYRNTKRWLKEHPGYLAEYRRRNPQKVALDNERRRIRRKAAREAAADIQDSISLEPAVTKALSPFLPASSRADIQDSILPRIVTVALFSSHCLRRRYARLDRLAAPSPVSSSTLEAAVPDPCSPYGDDPRRGSHEENAGGEEAHRPAADPQFAEGGI